MSELFIPAHACEMSLMHNTHKSYYQTAQQAIEQDERYYSDNSFPSAEERQRCIDTDEIWTMHWYPNTPIGFNVIHASTLEALNAAVAATQEPTPEHNP